MLIQFLTYVLAITVHFTVSIEDDNKNSKIAPFFLII
jgi:hypothetical protein